MKNFNKIQIVFVALIIICVIVMFLMVAKAVDYVDSVFVTMSTCVLISCIGLSHVNSINKFTKNSDKVSFRTHDMIRSHSSKIVDDVNVKIESMIHLMKPYFEKFAEMKEKLMAREKEIRKLYHDIATLEKKLIESQIYVFYFSSMELYQVKKRQLDAMGYYQRKFINGVEFTHMVPVAHNIMSLYGDAIVVFDSQTEKAEIEYSYYDKKGNEIPAKKIKRSTK